MKNPFMLLTTKLSNKDIKKMNSLTKLSAVVCLTLSGAAYSGDKHDGNKRDLHEFIAAQGTFCADLLGNGECMLLNAPLNNIFSWSDPVSFRMGYFDYSGVADRAFNGRFGARFNGDLTETELPDGRGLVKLKLHTKNAISWAYIRDPYNPFSQPSEQLFGHWITADYAIEDGFVRGESMFEVDFTIPEFGGPMPDLIQWAYMPPPGAEIQKLSFKGCAYDAETKTALVINQDSDESRAYTVEDVLIIDVSEKMANAKPHKTKKNHKKVCKKYLK